MYVYILFTLEFHYWDLGVYNFLFFALDVHKNHSMNSHIKINITKNLSGAIYVLNKKFIFSK